MAERVARQEVLEEAELLARAERRDVRAFETILQRYNQRLYRLARSIVRNDSDAEDVLQEAYCRAFANLASFRGEARLGTWLGRITINEALGHLRRQRPAARLDTVADDPALTARIIPFPNVSMPPDPEMTVAQREIRVLLERAIDTLPDSFRTVLVARVVEGMSVEDAAELFGIPPETVKTRLHRARRLLRQAMDREIGPVLGEAFPFAGRRCELLAGRVLERFGLR